VEYLDKKTLTWNIPKTLLNQNCINKEISILEVTLLKALIVLYNWVNSLFQIQC